MISGFYRPDTGSITFEGQRHHQRPPVRIATLGIARTFQNIALFGGMTVLDNIMLGPSRADEGRRVVVLRLLGPRRRRKRWRTAPGRGADRVPRAARICASSRPARLPYGLQKARRAGPRALALDPTVLLLDEPMGGMNQEEKEDMARYILERQPAMGHDDHPDRARHGAW